MRLIVISYISGQILEDREVLDTVAPPAVGQVFWLREGPHGTVRVRSVAVQNMSMGTLVTTIVDTISMAGEAGRITKEMLPRFPGAPRTGSAGIVEVTG